MSGRDDIVRIVPRPGRMVPVSWVGRRISYIQSVTGTLGIYGIALPPLPPPRRAVSLMSLGIVST